MASLAFKTCSLGRRRKRNLSFLFPGIFRIPWFTHILVRNYAKDRDKFCDFSLVNITKINKKGDFYAMNQKKGLHRNMFILAQSAAAMFQTCSSLRKAQRPCFKNFATWNWWSDGVSQWRGKREMLLPLYTFSCKGMVVKVY